MGDSIALGPTIAAMRLRTNLTPRGDSTAATRTLLKGVQRIGNQRAEGMQLRAYGNNPTIKLAKVRCPVNDGPEHGGPVLHFIINFGHGCQPARTRPGHRGRPASASRPGAASEGGRLPLRGGQPPTPGATMTTTGGVNQYHQGTIIVRSPYPCI